MIEYNRPIILYPLIIASTIFNLILTNLLRKIPLNYINRNRAFLIIDKWKALKTIPSITEINECEDLFFIDRKSRKERKNRENTAENAIIFSSLPLNALLMNLDNQSIFKLNEIYKSLDFFVVLTEKVLVKNVVVKNEIKNKNHLIYLIKENVNIKNTSKLLALLFASRLKDKIEQNTIRNFDDLLIFIRQVKKEIENEKSDFINSLEEKKWNLEKMFINFSSLKYAIEEIN